MTQRNNYLNNYLVGIIISIRQKESEKHKIKYFASFMHVHAQLICNERLAYLQSVNSHRVRLRAIIYQILLISSRCLY